jgi:filamentous hemagglutinin family protein
MKPKPRKHLRSLVYRCLWLSTVSATQLAHANGGIVTDGSMGAVHSLTGNHVTIPQDLGTTVGHNLFHSFGTFNVHSGQTVTFTENTTNSLANVISRVTGGSASDINGLIRSTPGGHANFFLINPAGIVFGKDALIDVAGAFHASTAELLNFGDGKLFSADGSHGSSLSSAEPASFGFLASSAANNGLLQVNGASLSVKPGQTLDLVGGQIKTDNATLNAPGGEIRLVAIQGAGNVGLQRTGGVLPLPQIKPSTTNAGTKY